MLHANCPDYMECIDLRFTLDPTINTATLITIWKAFNPIFDSNASHQDVFYWAHWIANALNDYGHTEMLQSLVNDKWHSLTDSEIISRVETYLDDYIKGAFL